MIELLQQIADKYGIQAGVGAAFLFGVYRVITNITDRLLSEEKDEQKRPKGIVTGMLHDQRQTQERLITNVEASTKALIRLEEDNRGNRELLVKLEGQSKEKEHSLKTLEQRIENVNNTLNATLGALASGKSAADSANAGQKSGTFKPIGAT